MYARHRLKYHLLIPGIFVALVLVEVSVGTALHVALATGCMSMMLMGHSMGRSDESSRAWDSGSHHHA